MSQYLPIENFFETEVNQRNQNNLLKPILNTRDDIEFG